MSVPPAKSPADAWWVFPAVPLFAAAVAFTWILSNNLARAYGMTAPAWDLAYDQQVIWNLAQGHGFNSSFVRAGSLSVHLELIFVALAAIEKLWPSPTVLLIAGSAGLAASAPAAYVFFRSLMPADRAESPWVAIALSAPVPFWVATQEAARDFFHPENFALAFALLAAWAGLRGHRIVMWLFIALDLSCQENQAYTVAVIALLMAARGAPDVKKHWRPILYVAAAWLVIGIAVTGARDYAWLLNADPLTVGKAIVRPEALLMVATIVASMFGLPALAPRWLLPAVPPYLVNVLSSHSPQNELRLHYVLLLMFPLLVAGGIGARRFIEMRSLRPAVALAALLPALILAYGAGRFPPALNADPTLYDKPNAVTQLRSATAVVPPDSPVSADDGLAMWLANRHTINDFPDRLDGNSYVVIDSDPYVSGPTNLDRRNKAASALPASGRRLLYDDGRFQVYSPVGD